jgi:hypothetical protein
MYLRDARRRDAKKPVVDIGLGGLRCYSDEDFPVGERFNIEVFLPDGSSLTALVRAAWVDELEENAPAKFEIGFELVATDPDQLDHLKKIIEAATVAEEA